jgi:hypothetical protein
LRETLYGHGPLTAGMAIADTQCELGQWLQRREEAYGHLSAFQELKQIHSRFHRRAAYCLQLAAAGRRGEAIAETDERGELRRLSRLLVSSFHTLQLAAVACPDERRAFRSLTDIYDI